MSVGILFLIISVASANNAQRRALSEHFTTILKEKGSSTKAWPLPVPARFAATLLHLHTPLIFDDDDEDYKPEYYKPRLNYKPAPGDRNTVPPYKDQGRPAHGERWRVAG